MNKLRILFKAIKWFLNRSPKLKAGDIWYAKYDKESCLGTVKIIDVTKSTVEIIDVTKSTVEIIDVTKSTVEIHEVNLMYSISLRYKISDIGFVEKA